MFGELLIKWPTLEAQFPILFKGTKTTGATKCYRYRNRAWEMAQVCVLDFRFPEFISNHMCLVSVSPAVLLEMGMQT